MNRRSLILRLAVPLLAAPTALLAQKSDTLLRPNTIEVIQTYKPVIRQTPKPEFTPGPPARDTTDPVVSYSVPSQSLYFIYHSLPLKPLSLGRKKSEPSFPNYVRAAGGNRSTLLLEAGVGSLKVKDVRVSLQAHHESRKGSIPWQQTMHSGFEAEATTNKKGHVFTAGLEAYRSRYYAYGFDRAAYPDAAAGKIVLGGAALHVSAHPDSALNGKLFYEPSVRLAVHHGSELVSETDLDIAVPVRYRLSPSVSLIGDVSESFTGSRKEAIFEKSTAAQANLFRVQAGAEFHRDKFSATGRIGLATGAQTQEYADDVPANPTYFLPSLELRYRIAEFATVRAGFRSEAAQNRYSSLFLRNPFSVGVPSQYLFQTKTQELSAGVDYGLTDHLTVTLSGGARFYSHLPMFTDAYPGTPLSMYTQDVHRFMITNLDRVTAGFGKAAIGYQVGAQLNVRAEAEYIGYRPKTYFSHLYNEPSFVLKSEVRYAPIAKLRLDAGLIILGGIWAAKDDLYDYDVRLKPVIHLGAGAEYDLIPRLTLFARGENLLNRSNERWLYYTAYGINLFGGLHFKF